MSLINSFEPVSGPSVSMCPTGPLFATLWHAAGLMNKLTMQVDESEKKRRGGGNKTKPNFVTESACCEVKA